MMRIVPSNDMICVSIQCADMLYHYTDRGITARNIDEQPEWLAWQKVAYDEPDFLLTRQDYLTISAACRTKAVENLTLTETRACITFLIRQMRFECPPYRCLTDGSLADLLMHWAVLVTDGNETGSTKILQKDGENT